MEFEEVIVRIFYGLPVVALVIYIYWKFTHHAKSVKAFDAASQSGEGVPATLHPVFDYNKCMGCGSCAAACPEGKVIGLIKRKPRLINPSRCIGHGACKKACPFDTIKLVFGSAERGVDIPQVSPTFETNIPGLFIAGELGGMGLIRNAITQGVQALQTIKKQISSRSKNKQQYDLVIVGAGPAGFAATLGAMEAKLKSITIEQDTFGGTVAHFPRGKLVMTSTVTLPLEGKLKLRETSKEALLESWYKIAAKHKVKVNTMEAMKNITQQGDGFIVETSKGQYHTRKVLLTIGRRGTPRTLNVPGEEKSKVVYRLDDAEQYSGQKVLVVGGGDSALEAACSIADVAGTQVTISYRNGSFNRAKPKNRERIDQTVARGDLTAIYSSNVKQIDDSHVAIECNGEMITIENDAVIICAGGVLPAGMLRDIGVNIDTKYGTE